MSYAYDQYLAEHIANVTKGLLWMQDNLGGTDSTALSRAIENAAHHDASKYDIEEYDAYDQYFYGGNRSYQVDQDFNYAWLDHQKKNPHHWQYWVLINDDAEEGTVALRMPLVYIYEMIADWWTFSWKNNNLMEMFKWYGDHRSHIMLHPETRAIVEDILKRMWNVLLMTETLKGKNASELEREYVWYWAEQEDIRPAFGKLEYNPYDEDSYREAAGNDVEFYGFRHADSEPIGKVVDTRETENGLEITVEHSGIKGQKWGIRNGPPYPLDSAKVAEKLYSDAQKKSKKITKDIENAAKKAGGVIHGLENQLKTKESIERKLNKKINERDMDITEAANSIKDAVRYTVIATTDNFVNMYYDFKADMENKGYSETSCDNYFDKFSKGEVKHKAIQSNFADKDGYEFEVQFHTPESQDAKDKKLPLYNERRTTGISESRAKELEKQMENLAVNIPDPEGVRDILSHGESEDDEDLYGVPELKKFPMPDKKHVKSAIRFFNYVDPKFEQELAEAILEKAEEFGLDLTSDISVGDENRFKKYLPKE